MKLKIACLFIVFVVFSIAAPGQQKLYKYVAQRNLIPVELGAVYVGIPFKDLAKLIDLKKAEADAKYGPLEVNVPIAKGNITEIVFKVQGVTPEDAEKSFSKQTVKKKDENGEYEEEINRLDPSKITAGAFVYEYAIFFKKGFDLKSYSLKKFGPAKDVHKKGDVGYFYDLQWTKKTADGLTWLIRYHGGTGSILLAGVIKGTEWSID